jgi:hypothetical protein
MIEIGHRNLKKLNLVMMHKFAYDQLNLTIFGMIIVQEPNKYICVL